MVYALQRLTWPKAGLIALSSVIYSSASWVTYIDEIKTYEIIEFLNQCTNFHEKRGLSSEGLLAIDVPKDMILLVNCHITIICIKYQ